MGKVPTLMFNVPVPYRAYGWKEIEEKGNEFLMGYMKIEDAEGQKLIDNSGLKEGIFIEEVVGTMTGGRVQEPVKWIAKTKDQTSDQYIADVRRQAMQKPAKEKKEIKEATDLIK